VILLESWSHSRLLVVPTSSQLRGTVKIYHQYCLKSVTNIA